MKPVTDPALIEQLEAESRAPLKPVSDPAMIERLERDSYYSAQPQGGMPVDPRQQSMTQSDAAVGRVLGLTGRALAGGLAQIAQPFDQPVRYMLNKALPGDPFIPLEQATDQALTAVGVPEPETGVDRAVQGAGRFVTSFAGGMGMANKVDDAVLAATGLVRRAAPAAAPTISELRRTADAAYKAADDAGLVIANDSFGRFAQRLTGMAKSMGLDKDIQPKATAAIRRITEAADSGQPVRLEDFEILRRVVGAARSSVDASERKIGTAIVREMDDYISRIGGPDVIAGDPKAASEALSAARNAWSRMSKSETVQEAIEKAGIRAGQFSGSGFENALRTQFRQISMNNKRMRGFTQEEQAAIKKVAMGGPVDNAFRALGKLAPTGVVSAGFSGGAGYAMGGPIGAVVLPAVGGGARKVATKMTERNVQNLDDMVRAGGAVQQNAPEWLLPWLSGGIFAADTPDG